MLRIDIKNHAQKFLNRLQRKQAGQIGRKILALAHDPFPPDSKQLKGSAWRGADIGEYRIMYYVDADTVHIPLVGKRNDDDVYRRMRRMQ